MHNNNHNESKNSTTHSSDNPSREAETYTISNNPTFIKKTPKQQNEDAEE